MFYPAETDNFDNLGGHWYKGNFPVANKEVTSEFSNQHTKVSGGHLMLSLSQYGETPTNNSSNESDKEQAAKP